MSVSTELDSLEMAIIDALQNEPQLSNKDLAAQLGVAASTCHARVRSLRARGVIREQMLIVAPEALGRQVSALIEIRIRVHSREVVDSFWTYLMGLPETVQAFHVSGAADFLLHVAVPSSEALKTFLLDSVTTRVQVEHLETHLVFEYGRKRALEFLR